MVLSLKLYVLLAAFFITSFAQVPTILPLSIPASGQWDGIDGPWSTFNLGVGNPIQLFRCIPGISQPVVMLPGESRECNSTIGGACRDRATFHSDASNSWRATGLYDAPLNLDFFQNRTSATWGIDKVSFGNNAIRDIGFAQQYVLLIYSLDFFVGIFGLSTGTIGSVEEMKPTLLSAIAGVNAIPSNSFSYTAGSSKRNTTGSLILGGYDTSRFDPSTTISVPMPSRLNTSLIVNLDAIYLHGQTEAKWPAATESNPIAVRIDSILPQIWLPPDACKVFEEAFNLTWSDVAEAYILDEATHERLLHQNPSVNFTISSGQSGFAKNFTLPYSAFDLRLEYPYVAKSTPYFPLKRANSSMQYMLGRVFLQETYVIVDYGRANFSLSQAYSTGGSGYTLPISDTTFDSPYNGAPTKNETGSGLNDTSDMSAGAYASIGVGVALSVLIVAGTLLAWKKAWGFFRKRRSVPDPIEKPELHGEHKPWVEALENERAELPWELVVEAINREAAELETTEPSHEAGNPMSPTVEGHDAMHELEGDQSRRSESSSRTDHRLV